MLGLAAAGLYGGAKLIGVAADAFTASTAASTVPSEVRTTREYVRGRVKASDQEWLSFLDASNAKWQKFADYRAP